MFEQRRRGGGLLRLPKIVRHPDVEFECVDALNERNGYVFVSKSSAPYVVRKSRHITNCPMTAALFPISLIVFRRSPAQASVSCLLYVKW